MYISADTGRTWQIKTMVDAAEIYDVIGTPSGDVYVAGGYGNNTIVYKSTDHGQSWYDVSSGLNCIWSATCIQLGPDGYLYVGTITNGIYRSVNRVVDIGESNLNIPSSVSLHQNYPNPFNPSTTIRYELSKHSEVRLKIYNILGQEVRTLVNTKQSAGTHEVTWDGKDMNGHSVSSGIYLYRLECEGITKTMKLTLIR
jgi:hypothetical protein